MKPIAAFALLVACAQASAAPTNTAVPTGTAALTGTAAPIPPAACNSRVTVTQIQAQAVQFDGQPLTPQQQSQLPPARRAALPPLQGMVYWPSNAQSSNLPAVIFLHGSGGTQCDLSSAAKLMAAQGYVTLSFTQPDNRTSSSETSGVQALLGALNFLGSPANPARGVTRMDDIALVGHSEGAGVVSMAQGLPGFERVKAIVALDNLRRWLQGDPGSALRSCVRPRRWEVQPRVPALGLAMARPCKASGDSSANSKLSGWNWWRSHGVAAAELVVAGYKHLSFTDRQGSPEQLQWQAKVMGAWLGRWLKGDAGALKLLGCPPAEDLSANLSRHYASALFLPAPLADHLPTSTSPTLSKDLRRDLIKCSKS